MFRQHMSADTTVDHGPVDEFLSASKRQCAQKLNIGCIPNPRVEGVPFKLHWAAGQVVESFNTNDPEYCTCSLDGGKCMMMNAYR